MSSFDIPNKICDNLDALSRRFWWRPKEREGRYLAWKDWDKPCQPKARGGLGYRKAKNFNNALLVKLAWMVASKRDYLCMQILRAKYKVRPNWLHKVSKVFLTNLESYRKHQVDYFKGCMLSHRRWSFN